MIRVVLVDDQDLIRGGLRAILDAEPDIAVVAEAADGTTAATAATREDADVVLMDGQMPGVNGITGTREVLRARPGCRVLVLTTFDLDEYVFGALRAGASGFGLKTTPPAELAAAVRACHAGDLLFAPTVTRRLVETFVQHPPAREGLPDQLRGLTERELDVLRAIAAGLSNAEIAGRLQSRRGDGEDPRHPHPGQAWSARPRPSGRARLRVRARHFPGRVSGRPIGLRPRRHSHGGARLLWVYPDTDGPVHGEGERDLVMGGLDPKPADARGEADHRFGEREVLTDAAARSRAEGQVGPAVPLSRLVGQKRSGSKRVGSAHRSGWRWIAQMLTTAWLSAGTR